MSGRRAKNIPPKEERIPPVEEVKKAVDLGTAARDLLERWISDRNAASQTYNYLNGKIDGLNEFLAELGREK